MHHRKGFSLVELLVVIVIIAILFTILYPLINRTMDAAHKTNALSNMKQVTSAMMMYASDHQGELPFGFAKKFGRGKIWEWRFDSAQEAIAPSKVAVPSGWPGGTFAKEAHKKGDLSHWSHGIHPYAKSYEIYDAPGTPIAYLEQAKEIQGPHKPQRISITYNGLLHGYPLSNIVNPSKAPLVWLGFGKTALYGFASTTPYLLCNDKNLHGCIYHPDIGPETLISGVGRTGIKAASMWVYGKGTPIAYADGSVRIETFGSKNPNPKKDPFSQYDKNGVPKTYQAQTQNSGVPCSDFFRPDNDS